MKQRWQIAELLMRAAQLNCVRTIESVAIIHNYLRSKDQRPKTKLPVSEQIKYTFIWPSGVKTVNKTLKFHKSQSS